MTETDEAEQPCAWAVVLAGGQRIYDVYGIEEEAKAIDAAVTGNHGVVPLYRSPTLTDAEREAIETSFAALQYAADELGLGQGDCDRRAATLRGLLGRLC